MTNARPGWAWSDDPSQGWILTETREQALFEAANCGAEEFQIAPVADIDIEDDGQIGFTGAAEFFYNEEDDS